MVLPCERWMQILIETFFFFYKASCIQYGYIKNVEIIHECPSEHLLEETTGLKYDK